MKPVIAAMIFDLDGTLVASLEDLADAVNIALAAHSFPTHPLEPYKYFVGDGMDTLVRRAAPEGTPDAALAAVFALAKQEYARMWGRRTRPYDGIVPMLEKLAAIGVPLAVLSNKPHEFTGEFARHFFPRTAFAAIQGSPAGGRAKPDPEMALGIAGGLGLRPDSIGFMGDSRTDMDTAVNAAMLPIGVLWGFRPRSELVTHGARVLLERPADLFDKVVFRV